VALEEVVLVEMVEMVTILLHTWVQMQKIILDLVAVDRLDLEPQEELVMVVLEQFSSDTLQRIIILRYLLSLVVAVVVLIVM